jgi:hypothetical protein
VIGDAPVVLQYPYENIRHGVLWLNAQPLKLYQEAGGLFQLVLDVGRVDK